MSQSRLKRTLSERDLSSSPLRSGPLMSPVHQHPSRSMHASPRTPLRASGQSPFEKRARVRKSTEKSHYYEDPVERASPSIFQSSSKYRLEENDVIVRLNMKRGRGGEVKTGGPRVTDEVKFRMNEVRAIVERAVEEREQQVRQEFEEILLDRLDEQFKMFSKHNEAEIHRQMDESTHDYFI